MARARKGIAIHVGVGSTSMVVGAGDYFGAISATRSYQAITEQQGYTVRTLISPAPDQHALASPRNGDATATNLIAELEHATRQLDAGDHLVLTFAGHGQLSVQPEGQTNFWILHDRPISDYELNEQLNSFARGVRILVLSDCCNSGTMITDDALHQHARFDLWRGYAPIMIHISAAQDNQLAKVFRDNSIFATAVVEAWNDGMFLGDHDEFRDEIERNIALRFPDLVQKKWIVMQPRLLLAGQREDELEELARTRPFVLGGGIAPEVVDSPRR